MQKQPRYGRGATQFSVDDEIAHLRGLNLRGLRSRWQGVFQKAAPAHLTQHLLFAVIAYRIQADRFGDLDHATRLMLDGIATNEAGPALSARLESQAYSRYCSGPGMGSAVTAGNGAGRRLCLERSDL